MSNTNRWDPRRELANLRENMNRLLEEGLASVSASSSGIALDMFETEDAVIIQTSPLVGAKPETIDVSITGDVLTIKGETRADSGDEGVNYLRKERRFGSFSRSITIPRPIKAEETSATLKGGILTVTIPKAEAARPKVIDVKTAGEEEA